MKKVISVRFKENGKSYYFDPAGADIKTGEYVIVETARDHLRRGVDTVCKMAVAGNYQTDHTRCPPLNL